MRTYVKNCIPTVHLHTVVARSPKVFLGVSRTCLPGGFRTTCQLQQASVKQYPVPEFQALQSSP